MRTLKHKFILGSGSKFRLKLLNQIQIQPDLVISPDIDETPLKNESQRQYSTRMAKEKAEKIYSSNLDCLVLSADTIICVGTKILGKPSDENEARKFLNLLSGRRHRCYTTICVLSPDGRSHIRQNLTYVKFKRLHSDEIDFFISTNEWAGCAGGYTISGYAGGFIASINGSYSAVLGLPLYETNQVLSQYIKHC